MNDSKPPMRVCILGQPGAGKTTLLYALAGLSGVSISEAEDCFARRIHEQEAEEEGAKFFVYETELLEIADTSDFIIGVIAHPEALKDRCRMNSDRTGDPDRLILEGPQVDEITKRANFTLDTSGISINPKSPKYQIYKEHIRTMFGMMEGRYQQ